jgi:hypothetical protein
MPERSRAEIGELIAKIYDRLDSQFNGKVEIADAVLLVELTDNDDLVTYDDGREVPATIVLLESTSDRVIVQGGIIEFARRVIIGTEFDDE